jgi:hypothetical protein
MQGFRTRRFAAIALVLGVIGLTSFASAAPLAVGATLFPVPGEGDPGPGSAMLATTGPVAFAAPGAFAGTLTSSVWLDSATGFMTFTYQLTNAAASPNAITRMTIDDFTGFTTDASFQTPAGGLAPSSADRLLAHVVGFSFLGAPVGLGALAPGTTSAVLVVQTNAPAFVPRFASVIDGGQVPDVLSFGPAIPEPASLGLLALVGGLLARRR